MAPRRIGPSETAMAAMSEYRKGGSVVTDYRKLFDLTGKTAVVLGAASGIG